jgi:hypothetical protein
VKSDCLDRNIGELADFISCTYDMICVSTCKTSNAEADGGWLLNSKQVTDFIKSRSDKIVIFGNSEGLSPMWKEAFFDQAEII